MEMMGAQPWDLTGASQKPELTPLHPLQDPLAWNDILSLQSIAHRPAVQDRDGSRTPRLPDPSSVAMPPQIP